MVIDQAVFVNDMVTCEVIDRSVTGKIGKVATQILRGVGMRARMWPSVRDQAWAEERGLEYVTLSEFGREADMVSLNVPLVPETKHIINDRVLAARAKPMTCRPGRG